MGHHDLLYSVINCNFSRSRIGKVKKVVLQFCIVNVVGKKWRQVRDLVYLAVDCRQRMISDKLSRRHVHHERLWCSGKYFSILNQRFWIQSLGMEWPLVGRALPQSGTSRLESELVDPQSGQQTLGKKPKKVTYLSICILFSC